MIIAKNLFFGIIKYRIDNIRCVNDRTMPKKVLSKANIQLLSQKLQKNTVCIVKDLNSAESCGVGGGVVKSDRFSF